MYVTYDFRIPPRDQERLIKAHGEFCGHNFRKIVARSHVLPAAALNYSEIGDMGKQSNPLNGMSPLRFGGFRDGYRLVGVGAQGVELVRQHVGAIHLALIQALQSIVMAVERSGQNEVCMTPYPVTYKTSCMVVSTPKKTRQWFEWRNLALKEGVPLMHIPGVAPAVESLIAASLQRQGDELHQDVRDTTLDQVDAHWSRELKVKLVSHESTLAVPCGGTLAQRLAMEKSGGLPVRLALTKVIFTAHAQLKGNWAVGKLVSRGNGHVFPVLVETSEVRRSGRTSEVSA